MVIEAVCRDLEVDEKELTSASKRLKVAHARAMVSCVPFSLEGREWCGFGCNRKQHSEISWTFRQR
jgi:hypothetical protein